MQKKQISCPQSQNAVMRPKNTSRIFFIAQKAFTHLKMQIIFL